MHHRLVIYENLQPIYAYIFTQNFYYLHCRGYFVCLCQPVLVRWSNMNMKSVPALTIQRFVLRACAVCRSLIKV